MKCPKCHYLGFETGDRCRNCGYDFSLLAGTAVSDPDIALRTDTIEQLPVDLPLNQFGTELSEPPLITSVPTPSAIELAPERADIRRGSAATEAVLHAEAVDSRPAPRMTPADELASPQTASARKWQDRSLPLFTPSADDEDDTPLVKLPAAPRPPLSVRRTTDTTRLRAVTRSPAAEPELGFADVAIAESPQSVAARLDPDVRPRSSVWGTGKTHSFQAGSAVRRLAAAMIDYAILLSIDAVVVYFTLRMLNAELDAWTILPRIPLVLFLALIKVGYFGMFTAMGGQTIGKMATGIRVVSEDGQNLGAAQSMTRTLAGALTALTLGLGFLPALGGEHRALHDRLARTRVVSLEPA
jgi:uncharacterized RDD family membrane protein YckC